MKIDTLDRTGCVVGVGSAAAGAVETGPAVTALRTGVDVTFGKFRLDLCVGYPIPYVTQLEFFLAHELVAGIQITPGGNGHVFGA